LYNNFAAESFLTKNFVADFIQLKFSFIQNKYSASHHMVIKPFLLLGLTAEYRSRRSMWSTLPPTVRSLWHSPAN